MTDIDTLVVRTLAGADALLLPIRQWGKYTSANREAGLSMLFTHGVPVRTGGDMATRKSGERTIIEAAEQGFLDIRRHGRDRFPYLKLTGRGEAYARALVGLPGRDVGLLILKAVAAKTDRNQATLDRLFCDEIALNGGKGWGDSTREDRRGLSDTELDYLPAASAGWLSSNSTSHGHVRYCVTEAGWAEIDSPSIPADVDTLPQFDRTAADLYRLECDSRLAEMSSSNPVRSGDIGVLPLPVAHVGLPIGGYRPKRPGTAPSPSPIDSVDNESATVDAPTQG
jgi:hypothetical protein